MKQVQVTAIFPNIAPARLADFKECVAQGVEVTKDEPGTLQYDWFFNSDETRGVVRQTFASSEAVLAHAANMGELLGELVELGGGVELELYGKPSPDVLGLVANFPVDVHAYYRGK